MRNVAVLIETSRAYGRGLIRGVAQYNCEHGQWAIYFKPQGLNEPLPPWLKNWKGDGILARVADRRAADAILKTGLPVVDLRGALRGMPMASIGVDNRMVAQLAFDHLTERGLRQFAFCGLRRGEYIRMDERCDHFRRLVEAAGFRYEVFERPLRRGGRGTWEEEQETLAEWLKSLPKPIGIMACNDDRGLELLHACRSAGVLVPEQVAVIGVDNDEYLCSLSIPPMSSIDIAAQAIGYEAAAILTRMMAGGPLPEGTKLIPPGGVITRESTDVLATEDPAVIKAVTLIRARACEQIRVADVVRHVAMSRVTLEQRLKAVLGRTIHQEIRRVQVEKAKELLGDRALSFKQIAGRCGFKYPQYLATVFRRVTGQTLSQYRDRMADRFID